MTQNELQIQNLTHSTIVDSEVWIQDQPGWKGISQPTY